MSVVTVNCATCSELIAPGARFCEACGSSAGAAQTAAMASAPIVPTEPMSVAPAAVTAAVRGTILRDTNAGPGMIMVAGVKKTFTLEQHWQGVVAPQVQMQVDVTLDALGEITTVVPVRAGTEELEKVKDIAKRAVDGGAPVVLAYIDRIGKPVLTAMLIILVSWIWLPAVSVTIMAGMKQSATLFDVLRLANSGATLQNFSQLGSASSGLYGLVCVAAMFAPLLPTFLKHKYAPLGYCAPLAFLAIAALSIYMQVRSMANAARDSMRAFAGNRMDEMADAMMQQFSQAISVGFGTYLSLAAALYLAWIGVNALRRAR